MGDDPTKTADPTPQDPPKEGKIIFDSQEHLDALIERRLAREKSKFSDYEEIRKKAETLEVELQKRKDAELSDMEKLKNANDELQLEIDSLKPFKTQVEERNKLLEERVEKEAEGIDASDKIILSTIIDPEAKLQFLQRIKSKETVSPTIHKKGGKVGSITLESIQEKKAKGDPTWREDYEKYRAEQGRSPQLTF